MSRANQLRVPMPLSLTTIIHFHQPHGRHPKPLCMEAGMQRVEVVTAGRGWVEHNGKWVKVQAGDLLWHWEGDYTIGRSDFDEPYRCLAVGLSVQPGQARNVPRFSRWEDLEELRGFTSMAVSAFVNDTIDRYCLLAMVWGRLLYQVRLDQRPALPRHSPPPIVRVLQRINAEYAKPLVLADLAETAGWSAAHLHDVFKKRLNTSPHRMLLDRRLQAAKELLISTDNLSKQISQQCGFACPGAFCREFKKTTGMTPEAYRRLHCSSTDVL
jgi:AraC-like DNA-binding protein